MEGSSRLDRHACKGQRPHLPPSLTGPGHAQRGSTGTNPDECLKKSAAKTPDAPQNALTKARCLDRSPDDLPTASRKCRRKSPPKTDWHSYRPARRAQRPGHWPFALACGTPLSNGFCGAWVARNAVVIRLRRILATCVPGGTPYRALSSRPCIFANAGTAA